jgi:hypothetical protein
MNIGELDRKIAQQWPGIGDALRADLVNRLLQSRPIVIESLLRGDNVVWGEDNSEHRLASLLRHAMR